ncbi:hypothetical protein D0A37_00040 [Microcoleus vaginatus HSN003]|nr:hypothetical protein D0A37_00040 [Microcoleus vaginatus HSN003]
MRKYRISYTILKNRQDACSPNYTILKNRQDACSTNYTILQNRQDACSTKSEFYCGVGRRARP